MKYKGFMYYTGHVQADGTITDAVVTANRLAIDWHEGGYVGHLVAETTDGMLFRGTMSYQPASGGSHQYELRLYRSDKDVLLFGTWLDVSSGEEGRWTFVLTPQN
jgi:hypothetical protein